MKYRREIDGLRALAVLPVIFYHAGFSLWSGGFVGVDVFFVISGYLITTIILSEQEQGRFSLVNFYERRARRILPALFLVMLACIPFAWFWLLPSDHKDFSQSLLSVSLFSSNILFWQESGYFEAAAEMKPLLHTWSLAVEEQYYVLFPLFLLLLWQFRKRWILAAIVLVGTVSLSWAQWGAVNSPSATFFLLPTRAWELMLGACAAFYLLYGRNHIALVNANKPLAQFAGLLGLGLIVFSALVFDQTLPFPSLYALLPTLGVLLIILYASAETFTGKLLGHPWLVGIGLISYSLYLWHQPVFVFARHRSFVEPSAWLYGVLIAAVFLAAFLTWKYVETPFRDKRRISRNGVFAFALSGSLVFLSIGLIGHVNNGFDSRVTHSGTKLADLNNKIRVNYGLDHACVGDFVAKSCRTSDQPELVVWGDSYAMHLLQGIIASNPSVKLQQMTMSICGPFFNLAPVRKKNPLPWAKTCLDFTARVHDWLQNHDSVKYIVLASPYYQYLNQKNQLYDGNKLVNADFDVVLEKLLATLAELKRMGLKPVLIAPTPSTGNDLGGCLIKASFFSSLDECDFNVNDIEPLRIKAYELLMKVSESYPVIWLDKYICHEKRCKTSIGDKFIYRDKGHLSLEGSAELGKEIDFYRLIKSQEPDHRHQLF